MKLRHMFGLMLCALLCLFAIGAKTAVYRPHQDQVKNLTATKVWQNDAVPSAVSTPVQALVLLATMLLLAVTFSVSTESQIGQPAVVAFRWFYPALAVRPPPSI